MQNCDTEKKIKKKNRPHISTHAALHMSNETVMLLALQLFVCYIIFTPTQLLFVNLTQGSQTCSHEASTWRPECIHQYVRH